MKNQITQILQVLLRTTLVASAAILVGVIAGPLLERGLLRFMYGRDEIVLVLVTYATFLILEDFIKLVWGVDPYFLYQPYGLLGSFDIADLTYLVNYMFKQGPDPEPCPAFAP